MQAPGDEDPRPMLWVPDLLWDGAGPAPFSRLPALSPPLKPPPSYLLPPTPHSYTLSGSFYPRKPAAAGASRSQECPGGKKRAPQNEQHMLLSDIISAASSEGWEIWEHEDNARGGGGRVTRERRVGCARYGGGKQKVGGRRKENTRRSWKAEEQDQGDEQQPEEDYEEEEGNVEGGGNS